MGVLMQAFYWDCPREEQQEHAWWQIPQIQGTVYLIQVNCFYASSG
jgi:hypothetical protein